MKRFNWWRNTIIVLSLLVSIAVVLSMIFVFPQVEKINKMHQQHAAELEKLELMEEDSMLNKAHVINPAVQKLFSAVYENDINLIQQLINDGQDVTAVDEFGQTALHITQNEAVANLLIKAGADINAKDFDYQMTPIFNKEVNLSKILVKAGADINARSKKGNTPLMWYCYSGYLEGVEYLVSLGADVNAVNSDGQTAYDIAETFGYTGLLEYLKMQGAP